LASQHEGKVIDKVANVVCRAHGVSLVYHQCKR
jgi:hypothetical protein